jgi:type II secretory ATPase GspE/PulE/Tfp pilus assembly ATPase PilB-like protein
MVALIADVPEPGATGAAIKAGVLVVLLLPWLYFAPWVSSDARRLRLAQGLWSAIVLGAGAVGMLVCLLLPLYVVGVLFYVVLSLGAVVAYTVVRDGRVDARHKILSPENLLSALKPKRRKMIEILTNVTIYDHIEKVVLPPDMTTAGEEEMDTYNRIQRLLDDMLWRRASEVDLTPANQQMRIVYVIDGAATENPPVPLAEGEAMIQSLKTLAGMDADERRRPQRGAISVDRQGTRSDMELSTAGTTGGQRLQFRIIQEVARTQIELLGMPEDLLANVRAITRAGRGLFIVAGPRASGVTSTLYSILRQHDAYISHVASLESAPAVDLENITQQPYEDDAKLPKVLAALVKRGLDVLMVDNCPNAETALQIAKASAQKPILLGMQATDSFKALAKWVKLCGNATAAVQILHGVMSQMLLRVLCTECREPYTPNPDRLAKLNLAGANIDKFYRPGKPQQADEKGRTFVCPNCQGSGYRGRTAAFELLKLNDEIRKLIIDGATVAQIRAACRKNDMLYLQEQALRKVIEGLTSIEEVVRVFKPKK